MTDYERRLAHAFDGEVTGTVLFRDLARLTDDPHQRGVHVMMEQVERATRDLLEPIVGTGRTAAIQDATSLGHRLAATFAPMSWRELWDSAVDVGSEALVRFQELRAMADAAHVDILDSLVAHEEAILAFCRLELAGETDDSLAPLRDYLETIGASPLRRAARRAGSDQ